ncbi:HTH_Tnp_Tc3_2 domain-containing protein [Trichonephila clavipes]|nr:HTH_Tnp_Tc3_2 domain-containing protein [Trichonephila clavipes]
MPQRNECELLEEHDSVKEAFLEKHSSKTNERMQIFTERDRQLENVFNQVHAFGILEENYNLTTNPLMKSKHLNTMKPPDGGRVHHNDESVREGYIRNGGKEVKLFTSALKAFQCNNRIVMAQRKHLDDFLRGRIIGRLECARTQPEESEELRIAQSVISRIWQRFQDDGNVSRCYSTGRPRVTTPNEDRYLAVTAKRNTGGTESDLSRQLFSATGTTVSRQTVYLREHWSICSYACQMCSTYRNSLSPSINLE